MTIVGGICPTCGVPLDSSGCTCNYTSNRCPRCFEPITAAGCKCTRPTWVPEDNPPWKPYQPPIKEGWKCPVCGGGVSPDEKVCPCTQRTTWTGNTY